MATTAVVMQSLLDTDYSPVESKWNNIENVHKLIISLRQYA